VRLRLPQLAALDGRLLARRSWTGEKNNEARLLTICDHNGPPIKQTPDQQRVKAEAARFCCSEACLEESDGAGHGFHESLQFQGIWILDPWDHATLWLEMRSKSTL